MTNDAQTNLAEDSKVKPDSCDKVCPDRTFDRLGFHLYDRRKIFRTWDLADKTRKRKWKLWVVRYFLVLCVGLVVLVFALVYTMSTYQRRIQIARNTRADQNLSKLDEERVPLSELKNKIPPIDTNKNVIVFDLIGDGKLYIAFPEGRTIKVYLWYKNPIIRTALVSKLPFKLEGNNPITIIRAANIDDNEGDELVGACTNGDVFLFEYGQKYGRKIWEGQLNKDDRYKTMGFAKLNRDRYLDICLTTEQNTVIAFDKDGKSLLFKGLSTWIAFGIFAVLAFFFLVGMCSIRRENRRWRDD